VDREERQQALGAGIVAIADRAQPHPTGLLSGAAVGAADRMVNPRDQQQRRSAAMTGPQVADVDLDRGYFATAIPGMLLSSPNSAEVTFTGKS
jgi:hypothetical protein